MRRNVLLFDLDGTLVDSASGIAAALNRVRAERGGAALAVDAVRPLVALGAEALVTLGLGDLATTQADDLVAFRTHLADVPADVAAIYPDVPTTLDRLAGQGWRMCVVTNKPERLARALLAKLGLAGRFATIVGGDTTGRPKPAPEPVRHALRALGAEAGEALFVGDSAIDAGAARACAIPFLLFTGGYGAAECAAGDVAARFDRYAALPDLVAGLRD